MKNTAIIPVFICLNMIAVGALVAAYLIGRESGYDSLRVAKVQSDLADLKVQVNELRTERLRSGWRRKLLAWIGVTIPFVKPLLLSR